MEGTNIYFSSFIDGFVGFWCFSIGDLVFCIETTIFQVCNRDLPLVLRILKFNSKRFIPSLKLLSNKKLVELVHFLD